MNSEERIIQYLEQEMSPDERQAFEQELQQDSQLAAEFEAQRQVYVATWLAGREQEKQRLDAMGRKMLAEGAQKAFNPEWEEASSTDSLESDAKVIPFFQRPTTWALFAAAAVVILLLVFRPWASSLSPMDQAKQLYTEAYLDEVVRENISFELRGTRPEDSLITHIGKLRAEGSYLEAAAATGVLIDSYPESPNLDLWYYYKGLLFLKGGNFEDATEALAEVGSGTDRGDKAQWYRALASLGKGDVASTREILTQIIDTEGHGRRKQAEELLTKL